MVSDGQPAGSLIQVKDERLLRSFRQTTSNKSPSLSDCRHSLISQVPSVTGSNLSTIAQRQAAKADLQAAKFELKFAEEEAELGKKNTKQP